MIIYNIGNGAVCCKMIVFVHIVIPFIIEEPQDVEFQETD